MSKIKLKYLCKSFSNSLAAKELNTDSEKGYPVYGAAGLMGYKDSFDTDVEYLGIVKDGAGVGRINIYPAKSSLLGTMATIIPNKNVNIEWLKFAITSLNLGECVDKATIPHIYFSVYGNSYIRNISQSKQQKIASYLDRKCTQIDILIANQQQQIEKLKAYKQSVITETVTKGLDSDVAMKDSGIEWIGEIPEHCSLVPMKYLADAIGDGIHSTPNYDINGDFFFINGNNIGEERLQFKESTNKLNAQEFANYKAPLLTDNTILITLNGATYGKTSFYNNEPVLLGKSAGYITLKPYVNKRYIRYYLQSSISKLIMDLSLAGTTIQNVSLRTLNTFTVVYPQINEQERIVTYLDRKCSQIDKLIALKQQKIEKLQQYKKSLIYEYVTGKKQLAISSEQ